MVEPEGYVDVNVFVYWLGRHPTLGKTSHEWVKRIEKAPRGSYVTSALTLYEAAVIIAGLTGRNLKDRALVEKVVELIGSLPGLKVVPLTLEDITRAAELVREHNLDLEDAVHLATALRSGAKEMISNDRDFDRTPLKRRFD
ncbi:MAG: type II toxin-antitoxin system VapC family toxin [Candidatus Bathyarchaeia archaeon]